MTAGTVAADATVVENRTRPIIGRVAIVTAVAAGDVRRRLAARDAAIVATRAGSHHSIMVNPRHGPATGRMTVLAGCDGLDVAGRLPGRRGAIVTAGAISADAAVIEVRRGPA